MEARTKRNIAVWTIIILVLLNISTLSTIWYHRYQFKQQYPEQTNRRLESRGEAMARRAGRIPPFISETMDLSPDQKNTLDSIWHHFNAKRRMLEDSMNQNRVRMFRIMMAADLDSGKYDELSEDQTSLLRELNYTLLEMNRSIRANLSEEQQKAMMEKMRDRGARERRHRVRK